MSNLFLTFEAKQNLTTNVILPKTPLSWEGDFLCQKVSVGNPKAKMRIIFLTSKHFEENFLIKFLSKLNGSKSELWKISKIGSWHSLRAIVS